jgi:hypothetical protein
MRQAIGTLISLFFLGAGFAAIASLLTVQLTPEANHARIRRWLVSWGLKGLLLPVFLWALLNIGVSQHLQAFMPQVQAARNRGGAWGGEYLTVLAEGVFLAGTYWSVVTLSWVLVSAYKSADESSRKDFKKLCLTWLLGLGIPVGLLLFCGGLSVIGVAGTILLAPIAGYSRDFLQPRKLPPMYARAIARMKFGKYSEAEWEIIKELENWEDDFDGWMMLAELYANHFNNLVEAEQTVLDLCAQPTTAAPQVAVAMHRLADWHLKLAQNPDAARRALMVIRERFPGTHLAHMAQLRIDQLPASAAELREQKSSRPIPLPALGDQMDEPVSTEPINRAQAARDANALVEQLRQNPNNITAREKLARVFTERLDKPRLGIEQLELLLGISDRSDAERAAWLGLIAAWHLKYLQDTENGRKTLERLVREYPNTIQAFAARRRLRGLASPFDRQQD